MGLHHLYPKVTHISFSDYNTLASLSPVLGWQGQQHQKNPHPTIMLTVWTKKPNRVFSFFFLAEVGLSDGQRDGLNRSKLFPVMEENEQTTGRK